MMSRTTIFSIVAIIGAYIFCQALADVGATKMIEIAGVAMPAGSLVFALTFTLRDLVHKRLGREWAQAAIIVAALCNIVQAFYLSWMARLPAPAWFPLTEAWASVFAIVPAIALGSIAAELVSELLDTQVYHFWRERFPRLPQWSRVLVSNAVSLPVDSFVFATLAFVLLPPLFGAQSTPFPVALSLATGQIVFKAAVTLVSMPGIYLVREQSLFE